MIIAWEDVPASAWSVVPSPEVATWYATLTPTAKAETDGAVERLAALGNLARMPLSRALGDGLFELRFTCQKKARRITYTFDEPRRIITLTTFWHQKRTESKEITRARAVLRQYKQDQENLRRKPQ